MHNPLCRLFIRGQNQDHFWTKSADLYESNECALHIIHHLFIIFFNASWGNIHTLIHISFLHPAQAKISHEAVLSEEENLVKFFGRETGAVEQRSIQPLPLLTSLLQRIHCTRQKSPLKIWKWFHQGLLLPLPGMVEEQREFWKLCNRYFHSFTNCLFN